MAAKLFSTDNVGLGGGPAAHRSRTGYKAGDWYSGKGYDLHVKPGTEVYSLTDGKVVANNLDPDNCKKGVYGHRVTILADNGDELYYTHIESKLKVGKNIKKGDLIGKVRSGCGVRPHLHVASRKKDVKDYVDFKTWAIIGGAAALISVNKKDNEKDNETDTEEKNGEQDPKKNQKNKKEPATDLLRQKYFNAVSIPFTLIGLPGLAESIQANSNLDKEIRRIKQLL